MKFYGIKHKETLVIAKAIDGDQCINISLNRGLSFHNQDQPYDNEFINKNEYEEITRKEFNDFFILQNKNMNQFIKEL